MAQTPSARNIAVAAEAIAAAQFARLGWDVSVQYGADQPLYDLIVARSERMLQVSVKGSQDGSWGLTQSFLANADYHGAIDRWLEKHGAHIAFCFVQFRNVQLDEMPRLYLARPSEVAERLRSTAGSRGDTILFEKHTWGARAVAAGVTEEIPSTWAFSAARVDALTSDA